MTTEKKTRLVPPDEWEKERPYMIMVHAKHWSEIKKSWKKACRMIGDQCETQLESVDSVIRGLDELVSKIMKER